MKCDMEAQRNVLTSFPMNYNENNLVKSFTNPNQRLLRLLPNDEGRRVFLKSVDGMSECDSRVVSFIGKNHSGKSFLGKKFLEQYESVSGNPQPAMNLLSLKPTTGDCRFFQGRKGVKEVTVLDLEGEDAGDNVYAVLLHLF